MRAAVMELRSVDTAPDVVRANGHAVVSTTQPGEVHVLALGPLEVTKRDQLVPLGERERAVLCALLVTPGSYREAYELADAVGNGMTAANVRSATTSLQRNLGRSVVMTVHGAYTCAADAVRTDLADFERLTELGQRQLLNGYARRAERTFVAALALWRGAPCIDLTSRDARALRARFRELRLDARMNLADARIRAGRPARAVADLEGLVVEEALGEQHWSLLMLALYRCGRRAEALAAFTRARTALVETAGIEPGPPLRDLEQRIRADDPSLAESAEQANAAPSQAPLHAVPPDDELVLLTPRERDVVRLAAQGLTSPQIASRFGTSPRTVGNQLQAAYVKLDVHDRIELAALLAGRV